MTDVIIPLDDQFRPAVNRHIKDAWAGPSVVTRGKAHDTSDAPGFVAADNGALTGYILHHIQDAQCEILVLQSVQENRGVGAALIHAVIGAAREAHCTRVWLVTTNDNVHAIRYYQRFGFALEAVHIDAMDAARKLKPSIPLLGNENIPIKHEFEFGYVL